MIIGFCGAIGAGKTTAARHLEIKHDYVRIGFAKVLKDMAKAFGMTDDQLYGSAKEIPDLDLLGGKTPRQFMQLLGHQFGRELIDPDIWVSAWRRQVRRHPHVVADDVRYPNEVAVIHELGGKVIHLARAGGLLLSSHESETQTIAPDHVIENFGDKDYLFAEIDKFLLTHKMIDNCRRE